MKLTINREKLNKGLQIVNKIVSNRPSLPILSNLLLTTEGHLLRLTATDLDLGITCAIEATIENEGSYTIPARVLSEFVSNNTDEALNIQVIDNLKAEIKSPKFKASIIGIKAEEFPNIPEVTGETEIDLELKTFIKAIRQTVIACALDDIRPALSGVYCQFRDKKLTIVATDSFRLGEYVIDTSTEVLGRDFIIPARTVHELIRVNTLLTGNEKLKIFLTENQLRFQLDKIDIISRLIEASYPAYEKIIPTEWLFSLMVESQEIQTALRASRIFSTTGTNNIRLEIAPTGVKIASLSSERGQSEMTLNAEVTKMSEENELAVAFNARYLGDAIGACEDNQVVLFIAGLKKPTVLRSANNSHYQHLVMPVDIKE